jgi:hypothetical protein
MLSDLPPQLDATWRRRFEFYATYGSPFSRPALDAYKALNGAERLQIGFNIWAFVFGILYYILLGITKRGIGIAAVSFIVWLLLIETDVGAWWLRVHAIMTQAIFGGMANYYYFIRVTQSRDEWDPLKDVRLI